MQKEYYKSLTGLRFVAAFLVFTFHFTPQWLPWRMYNVLQEWHIGVTVFFTLSGFLICMRYYDSFALEKNWFKRYMVNRIARIYPMYFILTTLTAFVAFEGWKIYFLNISFLRGFFEEYSLTGVMQGWSLTVEETFYICAPLIFLLSKKHWLWLQPIALLAAGTAITIYFNDIKTLHGFFGSYRFTYIGTFFGRCVEFFAGIQLALWLRKSKSLKTIAVPYTYIGAIMILIVTVVMSLYKRNQAYGFFENEGIFLNNFILPVFVCLLLYGLIKEQTALSKFLSTPAIELLGKSSYCFYLIHHGIFHDFFRKTFGNYFFAELIFMTLLSIVCYKLLEEPLNKAIKKLSV